MIANVTSLIDLAGQHGFGVAVLLVSAQLLLDRFLPVERLAAFVVGFKKSAPSRGAHRRVPTSHSNHPLGCTE